MPLAWVLSLAGAALIGVGLSAILPKLAQPDFSAFYGKGWFTIFVLAIVTPLAETLILAVTCAILLRFVREDHAIILTAFGWGLAHSAQAPTWGLVIFWPFIIFTTLFVVWKQRSVFEGILMAWTAHLLHNLLSSVALGFPGLLPFD